MNPLLCFSKAKCIDRHTSHSEILNPNRKTQNITMTRTLEHILVHTRHILVSETIERQIILLSRAAHTIGRNPENDICLLSDNVSRHHARLIRIICGGLAQYQLIDGNREGIPSRNGVRVNGQPVSRQILKSNDCLTFGGVIKFSYLLGEDIFDFLANVPPERIHNDSLHLNHHHFLSNYDTTSIMMRNSV